LAACDSGLVDPAANLDSRSLVTSADDVGLMAATEAELQQALTDAASDPDLQTIYLGGDIVLSAPLEYLSSLPLHIHGNGYSIHGSSLPAPATPPGGKGGTGTPSGADALVVLGSPDLTLTDLTVQGAPGHGIYMELPGDASGNVMLAFEELHLVGNGMSGLWVEEQKSFLTSEEGTDIDSDASIHLSMEMSSVVGNGFQEGGVGPCGGGDGCSHPFADYDGIRVNEGGMGGIHFYSHKSHVNGNAADGIELDDTDSGHVVSLLEHTHFDANGEQPQLFDGEENDDPEDAFDIDEAGAGDIRADFVGSSMTGSYDEGIDLDENGPGAIRSTMNKVTVDDSVDENIKFSEDEDDQGGGGIYFQLNNVTSMGGDDSIKLEVFGPGNMEGRLVNTLVKDSGDDGLVFEVLGSGYGMIRLQKVTFDNVDDDEINTDGDVTVIEVGGKK
jgi:hypothetical protein